jgi:hypothetical protein
MDINIDIRDPDWGKKKIAAESHVVSKINEDNIPISPLEICYNRHKENIKNNIRSKYTGRNYEKLPITKGEIMVVAKQLYNKHPVSYNLEHERMMRDYQLSNDKFLTEYFNLLIERKVIIID